MVVVNVWLVNQWLGKLEVRLGTKDNLCRALAYTDQLAALLPATDQYEFWVLWAEADFGSERRGAPVPVLTRDNPRSRARLVRNLDSRQFSDYFCNASDLGPSNWRHVLATPLEWHTLHGHTVDMAIHRANKQQRGWALPAIKRCLLRWRADLQAKLLTFLCVARRLGFPGVLVRDLLAPHVLHDLAEVDARLALIDAKLAQ